MNVAEGSHLKGDVAEQEIQRRIAVAAHELKTPLNLIRALSFAFDASAENPNRQLEIIQNIRQTSESALRLTTAISQNYATANEKLFELEPLIANNLLQEIIAEITPLAKNLGQKIMFRPQKCLPIVANRPLLKSALLNVIDNSLKYNCRQNPITIKTHQKKQNFTIEIENDANLLRTDFNNLRENLGKQFQPISDQPLSSGMGIMIAKNFLAKMNGELHLKKTRRDKICFEIVLLSSRQLSFLETS